MTLSMISSVEFKNSIFLMDHNPLITVFLPTYNRPKFALESLKTLLKQSYFNKRIIVSDNSSDNQTEVFLKKKFS